MSKKTAVALTAGVALVGLGAVMLWPRKAGAAEADAPVDDEKVPPVQDDGMPDSAAEAYRIGMSVSTTDGDYVQRLADYVSNMYSNGASDAATTSTSSRDTMASNLQRRAYALKAEVMLAEGLKQSTDLGRVQSLATQLQPTHPAYASVLALRIAVQTGKLTAPAPTTMTLISGGTMLVDLTPFAPESPSPTQTNGGSTTVQPSVTPTPVVPTDVQPIIKEEIKPENDPNGTVLLARMMLDEQSSKNWKYVSKAVEDWQRKVGLTADGKFGPGSAMKMAEEVAIMPWVRYWPAGSSSKSAAVQNYRGRLKAYALSIAKTRPEHATMLVRSADAEIGQGWPASPSSSPATQPTVKEIEFAKTFLAANKR